MPRTIQRTSKSPLPSPLTYETELHIPRKGTIALGDEVKIKWPHPAQRAGLVSPSYYFLALVTNPRSGEQWVNVSAVTGSVKEIRSCPIEAISRVRSKP